MNMKILGIVTARGSSKRIPKKSITPVLGRPAMAYVCDAFKKSALVNRFLVDTDSAEMAEVGRQNGAEVAYMRPKELAQDSTTHVDVLKNAVKTLKEKENYEPDIICLVQPTSPLVKTSHIDESIKLLLDSGADSVEGIFAVPKIFHPHNARYIDAGGFTKFLFPKEHAEFKNGKKLPRVYAIGTVIAFRPKNLWETNTVQGAKSKALIIEPQTAIDIDEPADVVVAEAMLNWTNS